jgi:SPP1 family predicted phage head-tail adaptor
MLAAGKLRHRVIIQRRQETRGDRGETLWTWVNFPSTPDGGVWAAVEPLSVREFISASATQSAITTRITIRTLPGFTPDMRILHNGTIYNPAGALADNDSGLEYMTIPCTTGANPDGA